ncbi:MAG TPA: calcium/sodium antiporter [Methanomassiliicoccales archaeon]|nr:calcium/sodium antiporter [Methanomassiliicoccales archaeon]
MIVAALAILLGFGFLYLGSKWMVDGAAKLSMLLGVPPFIVGITIVAFGSSAPEAVLAITAAATESTEIALGGIIGSNIANIGLVLGISAFFCPIIIREGMLTRELGFMLLSLVLITAMAILGGYTWIGGALLLMLMAAFMAQLLYTLLKGHPISEEAQEEEVKKIEEKVITGGRLRQILLLGVGLAMLIIGAQVIIWGAVGIAEGFGIDKVVIGLTTIALGTSLPELSICITAARRCESAFVVSNILGSNIFNSLFVLGLASLISPILVPRELLFLEFPVMLLLGGLLVLLIFCRGSIRRLEGSIFLAVYASFIVLLASRSGLF